MKNRTAIIVVTIAMVLSAVYLVLHSRSISSGPSEFSAAPSDESDYQPVPGLLITPGQSLTFRVEERTTPSKPVFQFRNASDEPISFISVYMGCSCTSTEPLPDQLQPGEEVEFRISVNSIDTYDTEFASSIQIRTNKGTFRLYIKAQLPQPTEVRFRPSAIIVSEDQPTSTIMAVFPSSELCQQFRDRIRVETIGCDAQDVSILSDPGYSRARHCRIVIQWASAVVDVGAHVKVHVGEQVETFPIVSDL